MTIVARRFRLASALMLVVAVLAAGCTIGSGSMITETRNVSGFDEIVLLGSGDVIVSVTGTESLEIEAEDNVMPLLTSDVIDGRLELGVTGSITTSRGITYTITAAQLEGVTIRGSGDINGTDIDAISFEAAIEGSGRIDLTGTSDDLTVRIEGSGDFDGRDLVSATGTVTVDGSGAALVNVTDELTVTINGSGDVEFIGDPLVFETINGSGNVSRR
jgi:T5SS/PEP-CTERM-associated repeat protein